MELTTLKYFIEVANTGSQSRAAKNLHISQSAISRQLALLESEAGQVLFHRNASGLTLTTAGQKLLESAVQIVRLSDTAIKSLADIKQEITEPLHIGYMDGAFSSEASKITAQFRDTHPKVSLTLYTGIHKAIKSMLENNEIDIAYMYFYQTPKYKNAFKTGTSGRLGILTHKDDIQSQEAIVSGGIGSLPLIVPQTEINNNDRTIQLPFDINDAANIVQTSNPFAFIDLALQKKACVFCVEPSSETIKSLPLIFVPITAPMVDLYYIQAERPRHKESAKAFMNLLKQ